MSEQQDSGPAFPFIPTDRSGQIAPTETGMSLRAYAAIKLKVPNSGIGWLDDMIKESQRNEFAGQELPQTDEAFLWELCESLAGPKPLKDRMTDPIAWELWQAAWQAKIRFIRADAMLKAREVKP